MPERVRETPAPGDNVTDATRQEAARALKASYAALLSAQGKHRAEVKAWQQKGVKTAITMKVIKDMFRDPDEVLADLHEEIRQRALIDFPTIQQDLTALWQPPSVPADEQRQHDRWLAREAGALAGREGQPRESNPHKPGSELHPDWDKGWLEDQVRIANAMGAGDAPQVDAGRARPGRKQAAADAGDGTGTARKAGRKRGAQPEGDPNGPQVGSMH